MNNYRPTIEQAVKETLIDHEEIVEHMVSSWSREDLENYAPELVAKLDGKHFERDRKIIEQIRRLRKEQ